MYEKAVVCRFGVCVLALVFACLLCFGGCAEEEEYVEPEGVLLTVRSGEESVPTYVSSTWSETWDRHNGTFTVADMAGIEGLLDDLEEYPEFIMPITYDGGVTFEPREDVTVGNLNIYIIDDGDIKKLQHLHNSSHDVLDELEPGEYYVAAGVTVQGKYIEEADEYENSGYDCIFKLIIE